jgi:hypothetical protein
VLPSLHFDGSVITSDEIERIHKEVLKFDRIRSHHSCLGLPKINSTSSECSPALLRRLLGEQSHDVRSSGVSSQNLEIQFDKPTARHAWAQGKT